MKGPAWTGKGLSKLCNRERRKSIIMPVSSKCTQVSYCVMQRCMRKWIRMLLIVEVRVFVMLPSISWTLGTCCEMRCHQTLARQFYISLLSHFDLFTTVISTKLLSISFFILTIKKYYTKKIPVTNFQVQFLSKSLTICARNEHL